ncbi:Uncharacterized protein dnm_015990 [Desulfonema magnum]|uniref:Uncharacterized protein n=1 Tax=Desulfonema magnum TaxID=45655 RepID=A0A975GM86_9BACT|nr:Uncharacterized protein dnm_015990 [Desulfonema magnum]
MFEIAENHQVFDSLKNNRFQFFQSLALLTENIGLRKLILTNSADRQAQNSRCPFRS